ncbi:MAG: NADH-quinone oxidoreductase subunit M [Cytophagaceae bacterium]|nr:NADH-quinone oxidoreductase subunit M [Cytophagaceae bacterium]
MNLYLLSFLIFLPLLAMFIVLLMPASRNYLYKYITLITSVFQLGITLCIIAGYIYKGDNVPKGVNAAEGFQYVERANWIDLNLGSLGKISIDYFVGLDGMSIGMIFLAALVLVIGALSSWTITQNQKGYHCLYLLLSTSIIGCFVALDFFLFYLFFELLLLPMYFLIGMWGGPRREYASIKFFLYTLLGSILILVVMIGLYFSVIDPVETAVTAGYAKEVKAVSPEIIKNVQADLAAGKIARLNTVHTFDIVHMMNPANYIPGSFLSAASDTMFCGRHVRFIAFLALLIGFAIKLPSVPFHTWLPDAHVEAPTPISVLLAALLLKVGAYGIIRIPYSIFPEGAIEYAWLVGILGVISIIYGALNALAMKDIKKLIAYSSVSHMGFVLLGLASVTAEGVNGAVFQMFSHGILSALLFLLAGVLYDRTGDRIIDNYRGLASRMPSYTIIVTITFFASLGLPGFSGFIGELFVLLGAFNAGSINGLLPKWMAMVGALGILIGAVYYLWTLQKMFFGKFWTRDAAHWNILKDLDTREKLMLIPLVLATIAFGLFPGLFFDYVSPSAATFVEHVMQTGKINLDLIQH